MSLYKQKINAFLHYGYLPDPEIPAPFSMQRWFDGSLPSLDFKNTPKSELIKIGGESLRASFKEEIGNDHDKIHIVPLSGGLDSRTILANLSEQIEPSKIVAITFGVPKSTDYERAQSISKEAGLKWEGIDLSPGKWKWNTDLLIDAAKRSEKPTLLFDTAVNHSIRIKFGNECMYWTGYMGDILSRIQPISIYGKTWEQAKATFIKINCKCKIHKLTPTCFSPEKCLPKQPYTQADKLDYYTQLNSCIRQQCLIQHIYSPKGYDIRHPFLNPKWVAFILSAPSHYRHQQFLYRKIQRSSWPHLFNKWNSPYRGSSKLNNLIYEKTNFLIRNITKKIFPIKLTSIMGADKKVNYIDWNYALRYQDDFKNVVYSNLQDLQTRKIVDWLDIKKLWTIHQNRQNDIASELMTLAALEIHLKAKTIN